MGITQEISFKQGYIHVVKKGSFSLDEAREKYIQILEAIARWQVNKVLIDARELKGNPKIIERFFYGEFVAGKLLEFTGRGVSRATKFAYVMKQPLLDPDRLGETVAVNRGMNCRAFDNLEEALSWLGIAE